MTACRPIEEGVIAERSASSRTLDASLILLGICRCYSSIWPAVMRHSMEAWSMGICFKAGAAVNQHGR